MFLEEGVKLEGPLAANDASREKRTPDLEGEDGPDPSVLARMRPEVRARRAKYARYVAGVCAGCVVLGLTALVKMMLQ